MPSGQVRQIPLSASIKWSQFKTRIRDEKPYTMNYPSSKEDSQLAQDRP